MNNLEVIVSKVKAENPSAKPAELAKIVIATMKSQGEKVSFTTRNEIYAILNGKSPVAVNKVASTDNAGSEAVTGEPTSKQSNGKTKVGSEPVSAEETN